MCVFICIKSRLNKTLAEIEDANTTPSQFALLGFDIRTKNKTLVEIEAQVKAFFKRKYDVNVEYVNPLYNVGAIMKEKKKLIAAEALKEKCLKFLQVKNVELEEYQRIAKKGGHMKGAPFERQCIICKKGIDL